MIVVTIYLERVTFLLRELCDCYAGACCFIVARRLERRRECRHLSRLTRSLRFVVAAAILRSSCLLVRYIL